MTYLQQQLARQVFRSLVWPEAMLEAQLVVPAGTFGNLLRRLTGMDGQQMSDSANDPRLYLMREAQVGQLLAEMGVPWPVGPVSFPPFEGQTVMLAAGSNRGVGLALVRRLSSQLQGLEQWRARPSWSLPLPLWHSSSSYVAVVGLLEEVLCHGYPQTMGDARQVVTAMGVSSSPAPHLRTMPRLPATSPCTMSQLEEICLYLVMLHPENYTYKAMEEFVLEQLVKLKLNSLLARGSTVPGAYVHAQGGRRELTLQLEIMKNAARLRGRSYDTLLHPRIYELLVPSQTHGRTAIEALAPRVPAAPVLAAGRPGSRFRTYAAAIVTGPPNPSSSGPDRTTPPLPTAWVEAAAMAASRPMVGFGLPTPVPVLLLDGTVEGGVATNPQSSAMSTPPKASQPTLTTRQTMLAARYAGLELLRPRVQRAARTTTVADVVGCTIATRRHARTQSTAASDETAAPPSDEQLFVEVIEAIRNSVAQPPARGPVADSEHSES